MIIGDDHRRGASLLVDEDLLDLGRREALHDEVGWVFGERDDVDLLAPQFIHDHAHSGTTGTDTGTDRVYVGVVGPHGDLGSMSGLTGAGANLDHTVGNLRHLELE